MFQHGTEYRAGEHAGPGDQLHPPAATALAEHPAAQPAAETRQGTGNVGQAHRQAIHFFHRGVEHAHGDDRRQQGWQLLVIRPGRGGAQQGGNAQ
ncbi:hypothetical protein D3C85_1150820 [compost metagenome]